MSDKDLSEGYIEESNDENSEEEDEEESSDETDDESSSDQDEMEYSDSKSEPKIQKRMYDNGMDIEDDEELED
ncbi:4729_t:CDS:2 [Diversispora eburnea]|uniref:4729_t:CDS:1 n=1 Tax=Diversispora eburnea TaxID=1213867 RepID=A0A9N8UZL7_9GLOM|nr:4729_t:CDS:2 [Diversispora eburnea]